MWELVGPALIILLGVAIGWRLRERRPDPERAELLAKIQSLEHLTATLSENVHRERVKVRACEQLEAAAAKFVETVRKKVQAPEWIDEYEFLLVDRDWQWVRRAQNWAAEAWQTWDKIDQLSPSGRRNLEEECIRSHRGEEVTKTALLEDTMKALTNAPRGVTKNLFELNGNDFRKFFEWAEIVESIGVPAYRELKTFVAKVPEGTVKKDDGDD